jgi:hypothetical protein
MKEFVDRWNTHASWLPMDAKGGQLHILVFRANEGVLRREICDRYLNTPLGQRGRFEPFLPYVFVTIARVKSLRATNQPYSGWGSDSEIEVALWAPLLDTHALGLEMFKWFVPYMFVNNPTAVQQGREIFGYPKEYAWFHPDFARTPSLPADITVHAYGIHTFGYGSAAGPVPVLTIAGPTATDTSPWESFEAAAAWVWRRLPRPTGLAQHIEELLEPVSGLLPPRGHLVFLKQLPDITDTSKACYQQVVEAPITVPPLSIQPGCGELGDFTLTLPHCDSHPIASTLGLDATNTSVLGLWIDMDFIIEPGRLLPP